jgi:glutamate synthase domain-containing protein 1
LFIDFMGPAENHAPHPQWQAASCPVFFCFKIPGNSDYIPRPEQSGPSDCPNMMPSTSNATPPRQGLYDPAYEHDACGVGFVVNIKGRKSHDIIQKALTAIVNLDHRGACGCEANTGDGAGILMQVPDLFLRKACEPLGIELPPPRHYGVGTVFLPRSYRARKEFEKIFEIVVAEEGQELLGWRQIPTHNSSLGHTARSSEPFMEQVFIKRSPLIDDDQAFERRLYVIRKRAYNAIRASGLPECPWWHIASLSHKTLVYKGMLLTEQLSRYFPDLTDPAMESALALIHSRFSTNTFPSWERSHPYRYIAHNGEINTLRGNLNWMHTREALFASRLFGDDIKKTLPIIAPGGSDSQMFDNCLELLVLAGRPLPHAVMMMIPEPWTNHESMSEEKKAFYEYHSCLMEPWDGPASIAFTDGVRIGAVLDRNGLRPSRYYVTKDDLVIMASEVGVIEVPPENILRKGRLQPGRMFLVDTEQQRIVADEEIKSQIASAQPYRQWLDRYLVDLDNLPEAPDTPAPTHNTVLQRQQAFGYTFEDVRLLMLPMARDGIEAVGSMGNDAPLAVLSDRPQLLYNYFKQLFAQVTNPPIDCIREEIITSTETTLGAERNLLEPEPESCRLIKLKRPILTNEELAKPQTLNLAGFKSATLPSSSAGTRAPKASNRPSPPSSPPPTRPSPAAPTSSSSPTAAWTAPMPPSRPCSPSPACTITSSAKARAPAPASSSNPENPARFTIFPCSSVMAAPPSTPTSPSKPSRT